MESNKIKIQFARYVSQGVLGMIGLSCYILADTYFISQGIGQPGLTALNIAIPTYSLMFGMAIMIAVGGATRFSISNSKNIFTQSIYFAGFIAIIYMIAGIFFSKELAILLGAKGETIVNSSIYIKTILSFAPMFMLNNVLSCFVRNDKNPNLVMIAMLTGSFSNIILDYIMIFPLDMGMLGASLATGISPVISASILSLHFIKKKNSFSLVKTAPDFKCFKDIFSLGVSTLIGELSVGIVTVMFNRLIWGLKGDIGIAAYGVILNISIVITSIFNGISQGTQPLISRFFGEGKLHEAKKILKYGVITAVIVAILIYISSLSFGDKLVALFNKDGDKILAEIAVNGIHIYFITFIFSGINILIGSYLNSIEKPKNAFIISLLRGLVIIMPITFLMSSLYGITGIWLATPISEILVLTLSILILSKTKAKEI